MTLQEECDSLEMEVLDGTCAEICRNYCEKDTVLNYQTVQMFNSFVFFSFKEVVSQGEVGSELCAFPCFTYEFDPN